MKIILKNQLLQVGSGSRFNEKSNGSGSIGPKINASNRILIPDENICFRNWIIVHILVMWIRIRSDIHLGPWLLSLTSNRPKVKEVSATISGILSINYFPLNRSLWLIISLSKKYVLLVEKLLSASPGMQPALALLHLIGVMPQELAAR